MRSIRRLVSLVNLLGWHVSDHIAPGWAGSWLFHENISHLENYVSYFVNLSGNPKQHQTTQKEWCWFQVNGFLEFHFLHVPVVASPRRHGTTAAVVGLTRSSSSIIAGLRSGPDPQVLEGGWGGWVLR